MATPYVSGGSGIIQGITSRNATPSGVTVAILKTGSVKNTACDEEARWVLCRRPRQIPRALTLQRIPLELNYRICSRETNSVSLRLECMQFRGDFDNLPEGSVYDFVFSQSMSQSKISFDNSH